MYTHYTHYSVFRLLSSNTVHVPPPLSPVSISKEVRSKSGSRVQSLLQDDMFSVSLCSFRFRPGLWKHLRSNTSPFSLFFFKQLDLQKKQQNYITMVTCIVDEGTHTDSPPFVYTPPPPLFPLNPLSYCWWCFTFCVCFCSVCLCCLPACFRGCPMKRISKLAGSRNNAIQTLCWCVACVVVNKENLFLSLSLASYMY